MIPRFTRIKKSRPRRRGPVRDRGFMNWLHDKPCVICGYPESSAAHTENNGMRSKGNDSSCVPLCEARGHHREFDRDREAFERKYSIDMKSTAASFYSLYLKLTGKEAA